MRTTLDIQEDLLKAMRKVAHQRGLPFKSVVDLALRKGLKAGLLKQTDSSPYSCPAFSMGQAADLGRLDKALSLADELEEEEVARKLSMRK